MAKDPSFNWTKEQRRAAARKAGGGGRGAAGSWTNQQTKSYDKMSRAAMNAAMSEARVANQPKSSLSGMSDRYANKMYKMKGQLARV